VADLLKLAIYIRQIVMRPELREHLAEHHPDDLEFFSTMRTLPTRLANVQRAAQACRRTRDVRALDRLAAGDESA